MFRGARTSGTDVSAYMGGNVCVFSGSYLRGLASGSSLNGSEQTAGAGEQTEQPHQKEKGVNRGWTGDCEPQKGRELVPKDIQQLNYS
ncbi:hypothetical protein EYF80_034821 [Liparis tanakae]|uniref:Uncharacterized protein n=1 Tax=Liparis tanakae TaxID=230148 RepID=A0A4Z2GQA0_9TELE|nr:hypothetical protein EYF80_034821 [Liparis tanakae]